MSYRDKCEQLYLENQELKERLKEAKKEIDELYSGRLGACHTCEQVAELNIKLEQQLKEAEKVIEFYWDKCPINVMGEAFCGDNPSHQVAQDYFYKYKTNE